MPNEASIPVTLFINHDHYEMLVDPNEKNEVDIKKTMGELKNSDVISAQKATDSDNAENDEASPVPKEL